MFHGRRHVKRLSYCSVGARRPSSHLRMDWQYHPEWCGRCQNGVMQGSQGDLGALLHSWRDRLSPVDVGFPADQSRRTAGLRREELASLAGLSVDYVVRLEQGRAKRPSSQVAASLARALQLTDDERDHLFVVAGLLPPSPREVSTHIPPGVQRLIARLGEVPLSVFSASGDLVTWSPLWSALFGEPVRPATGRPNLLRSMFAGTDLTSGGGRVVYQSGGAEGFEASVVADLRRVHGKYPDDRAVHALVEELLASSDRFRELWESGAVGEHVSERKMVRNSVVGEIEFDCDVLNIAGSDLRIIAYTAPAGSDAAEKLDFLRVTAVAGLAPGR